MSEATPNPAPESPAGDLSAMLLGGLLGDGIETAASEPTTPDPDPTPAPEAPAAAPQEPAATPADPATPAQSGDVPVWSGQEEAGRAFAEKQREIRELKERLDAVEREKAYQAGLAAGRTPEAPTPKPAEAAPVDPEPNPDDFNDDAAYFSAVRAWDRRQAKKEAVAELAPQVQSMQDFLAQQAWDASMARAAVEAKDEWRQVVAYATHMRAISPGFDADINRAGDPGKFALDAYRAAQAGRPAPAPSPAAPAAAPVAAAPAGQAPDLATLLADPATQEAALRLIAAQRAAAGVVPTVPTHGPRGVGSGPGAIGVPDDPAVYTVEAAKAAKPAQLAEMSKATFGAFVLGG